MVTPDGKEWSWNGRYNTVATMETRDGYIAGYVLIMQGDPVVTSTHIVNGKRLNDADPNYMAEADAGLAKMKAEKQAKKDEAQKTASQQSKDYIDSAKGRGGILERGGNAIQKEDVDASPSRKKSGASATTANVDATGNPAAPRPVNPPATADAGALKKKPTTASTPALPPPAAASVGRAQNGSAGLQAR